MAESEERRAPVQASRYEIILAVPGKSYSGQRGEPRDGKPGAIPGSIAWEEHVEAWNEYARRYPGQSAERMAERGGFDWHELVEFLGHEPKTWRPR